MRALLASSPDGGCERRSSGVVRSLRGRGGEERGEMKFIFFISLPLYALDQLTKHLVLNSIDPDSPLEVVPRFLHIVNVTNTGAAFGSFRNNNGFFVGISCVALL